MAKVTLKDIAREVGVSPATVSLVLNGRPVRVSPDTRRKILECARRKHYVANQIARSLVTQRSDTFGLIVPNIESRFFSSFAKNLELRCRRRGYALLITNSDGLAENDPELVRLLANRGVDGVFLVAARELDVDPRLPEVLGQIPVPFVMVDRVVAGVSGDSVSFDSHLGGKMATSYLLEHGHRRVAIVANRRSATGLERLAGYEEALAEYDVALDPALELDSDYYIPEAYEVCGRLLETDATAVVATSDNIALGLLRRLNEAGVRVPRDLSIVSYDNSAADALFEPSLTSIEQNVEELSDEALRIMLQRIAEQAAGSDAKRPQRVLLTPRLIEKDSVRRH